MSRLAGQIILVAGGARGIGAGCARRLAAEGAQVVIGDADLAGARATEGLINDSGGSAVAVHYEQGAEESIEELVASAVTSFGGLTGLVANAADFRPEIVRQDTEVMGMKAAIWEGILRINLTGYALLIREALPHLLSAGGGGIVCTSSAGAKLGGPDHVAYAASKAGVGALVRHVATHYGKRGVRANAIAPGVVRTPALEQNMSTRSQEAFLRRQISPRLGEVEDIAAAAALLLSDEGSWITGQVIGVDGGLVMRD
jgi:NAD(P)-dependent dehydrogenase (short-subunit alcohol dehydrogenase family)